MRLDAYTHYIPARFLERMNKVAGDHKDIGKRMRGIPAIYDLDVRRKVIDQFKNQDYAQIISYAMPPIEHFAKGDDIIEYLKLINDGFAELCEKEKSYFPGWIAQVSLAIPDQSIKEAERAMKMGALGIQIYTNIAGRPLDEPAFEPLFAAMNQNGRPIWLHPARGANMPDYLSEKKSKYEIWWALGWSYETAAAAARLVFSKIMDKYPDLKIILHHFGAIIPALEGRLGPGWDVLGQRTSDEDYGSLLKSLKKRPLDYFKHSFWADTATFTARPAMRAGFDFYDFDKIVFASDCPFDPEGGTMYIRETIKALDEMSFSPEKRAAIDHGNFERLVGKRFKL
jgi:aminocarboxymuconate-semialdehyde decarboxylase